jgi:hypothetical protein
MSQLRFESLPWAAQNDFVGSYFVSSELNMFRGAPELARFSWRFPSLSEARMPKFHFEIVDGYTIEDPRGMELPTEQQAKRIAEEMAKQVAVDVEDRSLTDIVVKDANGEIVHTTPIRSDADP